MNQPLLLRIASIGTWVVCGLPSLAAIARGTAPGGAALAWAAMFVTFGVALVATMRRRADAPRLATALLVVQGVTAVFDTYLTGVYLDGTSMGLLVGIGLMVLVAAQLPHLLTPASVAAWIAVQTIAMTALVASGFGAADAVAFGLGSAGFQAFASLTTALMLKEASARKDLARVNRELQAARALLVEHSRAGERLRIARDLHDSLGHHLTALTLQLEVASRVSNESAAAHVRQAHTVARLLLADVRTVVGEMRERGHVDVAEAIRSLADSTQALQVHLEMPEAMTLADGAQAHSLLRCVQEIITNAARHAEAENLWIRIGTADGAVTLHAHDDGRGADAVHIGHGLQGLQERFAEYSGRLDIAARPGHGFELDGFMPVAGAR